MADDTYLTTKRQHCFNSRRNDCGGHVYVDQISSTPFYSGDVAIVALLPKRPLQRLHAVYMSAYLGLRQHALVRRKLQSGRDFPKATTGATRGIYISAYFGLRQHALVSRK